MSGPRRFRRRRNLVVAGVTGGLLVGSLAAIAFGSERVGESADLAQTKAARIVSASDFRIDEIGWSGQAHEEPILDTRPGQDTDLTRCGSDAMQGSVLVLAEGGVAYCLQGVDSDDPDSVFAARVVAAKLITGGDFTDSELAVLRLETQLGYATPETAEAAQLRSQYNAAWDALSKAEQDHLKE